MPLGLISDVVDDEVDFSKYVENVCDKVAKRCPAVEGADLNAKSAQQIVVVKARVKILQVTCEDDVVWLDGVSFQIGNQDIAAHQCVLYVCLQRLESLDEEGTQRLDPTRGQVKHRSPFHDWFVDLWPESESPRLVLAERG